MNLLETKGYHFNEDGIKKIETAYGAKHLGPWTIKKRAGWTDTPVDVFYQPNPDKSKGHSHYFGMYLAGDGGVYITDAKSAFSEPMAGIKCPDDNVIVSRYRHDYVTHMKAMVDGGRDYMRCSVHTGDEGYQTVSVSVKDGDFVFTPQ